MTDDEVLDHAPTDGFELVERMSAGQWGVRLGSRGRRPVAVLPRGTPGVELDAGPVSRGRVFV